MPKTQFPILQFQGGLHTDADPRDIAESEFSALEGFNVDSLGRIKLLGTYGNHASITAQAISGFKEGYGLFPFSSDYDDAGGNVPTSYLAVSEGDTVNIWDGSGNAWNGMTGSIAPFNLGDSSASATDNKPSFYAPNGDLRVCDGNFASTANKPKWLGHIKAKTYGGDGITGYLTDGYSDADISSGWSVYDASIESGLTSSNLKMINLEPGTFQKKVGIGVIMGFAATNPICDSGYPASSDGGANNTNKFVIMENGVSTGVDFIAGGGADDYNGLPVVF